MLAHVLHKEPFRMLPGQADPLDIELVVLPPELQPPTCRASDFSISKAT